MALWRVQRRALAGPGRARGKQSTRQSKKRTAGKWIPGCLACRDPVVSRAPSSKDASRSAAAKSNAKSCSPDWRARFCAEAQNRSAPRADGPRRRAPAASLKFPRTAEISDSPCRKRIRKRRLSQTSPPPFPCKTRIPCAGMLKNMSKWCIIISILRMGAVA